MKSAVLVVFNVWGIVKPFFVSFHPLGFKVLYQGSAIPDKCHRARSWVPGDTSPSCLSCELVALPRFPLPCLGTGPASTPRPMPGGRGPVPPLSASCQPSFILDLSYSQKEIYTINWLARTSGAILVF